jgi:hypothetical protein
MKNQLLSISMTLPMLLCGAGQSLASIQVINPGNFQFARPTVRTSQVKLDTQQPPPFFLAAREEPKKECEWLGICPKK